MARPATAREPRTPLSRERVLDAAVALADESGIESLTMRKLGEAVGVEAMSLYNHVANKDDILDGIIDLVFSEIDLPTGQTVWRPAMRQRAISARQALRRHPWATSLMESRRTPGPANIGHHDAVLGILRNAGFTIELAAHAYSLLDSYIYGFALQEASLPFSSPDEMASQSEQMLAAVADAYPHLATVQRELVGSRFDYADEFEAGLDIILGALPEPSSR